MIHGHTGGPLRPIAAAVPWLCLCLSTTAPRAAAAQPPCARLLTAAEVSAAAGPGFTSVGTEEPEPGKSECIWLLDGAAPRAISFTWWQRGAVAGGDLAAFFETQAQRAEKLHGTTREPLSGIGAGAVLVPGKKPGAMAIVVVRTADGVAYVETDALERAQVVGVGRAVAAP
jgi:hypothetical protein